MRYVFSLVRFVPDPATGEFVNVGAVAGSEESSDWAVRQVANPERARRLGPAAALDAVWSFLGGVGEAVDAHQGALESLSPGEAGMDEGWLAGLHRDHRNVVQVTYPAPVIAESAEGALDRVFDLMVVAPSQRRHRFRRRNEAVAAVRRAYRDRRIDRSEGVRERVVLSTARFEEPVDFAVTDGDVVQLAHSWSFQVPDQDLLARQVKSWGWTVLSAREVGGVVRTGDGRRFKVARDVDVEAVYIPPRQDQDAPAFPEACGVFEALGVNPVPVQDADRVAERAADRLRGAPRAGLGL